MFKTVNEEFNLERANKFWEEAEDLVRKTAIRYGLDAALDCAIEDGRVDKEQFLFDLFDYGEWKPTVAEIYGAIYYVTK